MLPPIHYSGGGYGYSVLQALRDYGLYKERHCTGVATLPLQGLRLQLHGDEAAREACGDEGAGATALCNGECEFWFDCPAFGCERRGGAQMGSHRGRKAS